MTKKPLYVYDRNSKKLFEEKIYGGAILHLLYSHKNIISRSLLKVIVKNSLFSCLYGFLQNRAISRFKIKKFIKNFKIDPAEFKKQNFTSFNDFFTRKLIPHTRPIAASPLIAPADARYLAIQDLAKNEGFFIKGEKFCLLELLKHEQKAYKRYRNGSLIIARLAPPDYHRFHFPLECRPQKPVLENNLLYSVNPIALRKNIHIIAQNKRHKIELNSKTYGPCLMYSVGATNVGSVTFSYEPNTIVNKGDEAGYFAFGGSMILLLFEKGQITIAKEILEQSKKGIETYCKMGQSLLETS